MAWCEVLLLSYLLGYTHVACGVMLLTYVACAVLQLTYLLTYWDDGILTWRVKGIRSTKYGLVY